MQYQAGYFFNSIYDLFLSHSTRDKLEKIVFHLAHFDMESTDKLEYTKAEYLPEIKIVLNMLQRGAPTIPPSFIADIFSTTFGKTKRQVSADNNISHEFTDDSLTDEIYKAIHIIDKRITPEGQRQILGDEPKEKGLKGTRFNFKYSYFPEYLGHCFLQLIEENRSFGSFIDSSEIKNKETLHIEFSEIENLTQDFVLEMPYPHQNQKGIAIELNDRPAETSYIYETDQLKQNLCKKIGWASPLNIETNKLSEINGQLHPFIEFTYNEFFDIVSKNYHSPLYNSAKGLTALQYALTPIAIARIERTILEYLLAGKLKLGKPLWKIAVIERDVPCAYLAFQLIKLHFENIFALKGEYIKFPEIKLSIYNTPEFKNAQLNTIYSGDIKPLEKFDPKAEYDLLLDISVLQRSGLMNPGIKTRANSTAVIRSVRSISAKPKFLSDKNISYADFFSPETDEKQKEKARHALKYFLRNIFRKDGYLPGQLELINHGLQQKNTLGLLPPSGGKTIAATLTAFLQPGISFFLCPNPHLISNHILSLAKMQIKNIVILDKELSSYDKLRAHENQLKNRGTQLAFISPDYLRSLEISELLQELEKNRFSISFLIADEAHMVSEWGHDFHPSCYHAARLMEKMFINPFRQTVVTIALSGTAGWLCTKDIQKEYRIDAKHTVRIEINSARINFVKLYLNEYSGSEQKNEEPAITQKANRSSSLKSELKAIKEILTAFDAEKTLIYLSEEYFNPIKQGNINENPIDYLFEFQEKFRLDLFRGVSKQNTVFATLPEIHKSIRNSKKFYCNETDILFAQRDFGVGTNKPDLQNIIFAGTPVSMENFIQQTYRAGPGNNKFNCIMLINKQDITLSENSPIRQYYSGNSLNADLYHAFSDIFLKYKGKAKEMAILEKLINGFGPYPVSYARIIEKSIENSFRIDIKLVFQPLDDARRIYINQDEKTFGYVDLRNLKINTDDSEFEKKQSNEILKYTSNLLKSIELPKDEPHFLLKGIFHNEKQTGINELLSNLTEGSSKELEIPFENNKLDELLYLLNDNVPGKLAEHELKGIYLSSISYEDFVAKIENSLKTDLKDLQGKVKEFYHECWTRNEIELAIYRLSKAGIVDDIRIDLNKQQFVLKISPKKTSLYREILFGLYDDYLMPEKSEAEKKLNFSMTEKGIKELLSSHLDFFYKYIINYRIDSFKELSEILRQVPEKKEITEEINLGLKEVMDRYFSAKYAINHFSLVEGTKSLMENRQDFGIIGNFIGSLGPIKENWLHLKKSCEFISRIKPENHLSYLLDACTDIFTGEKREEYLDRSFEKIARGFVQMRKQKEYNRDKFNNEIDNFLNVLYKYRPDLKQNYGQLLWLKIHYRWLKDFNRKLN